MQRRPHPQDRRAISVALTDDDAATARWITESRHDAARAVLGHVPQADLAVTPADQRYLAGRIRALEKPET